MCCKLYNTKRDKTNSKCKIKKLSFQCARCFKKDADKLAWFFSSDSLWADSLL